MKEFNQSPLLPEKPLPVAIIGAGGIIKDAHLPAYEKAGFPVMGIYARRLEQADALKEQFGFVQNTYDSLEKLIEDGEKAGAVFDLALPASLFVDILKKLPNKSCVLIQKPMGETLEEAKAILDVCKEKELVAGINFQMPYAPYMLVLRQMIEQGMLGEIYDMEVNVNVFTPWHLWDFLFSLPRMEILYHSVHYLDMIRSFLGSPQKVYGKTIKHPKMAELASTKTTMILDYGEFLQAKIITNHGHEFGTKHQNSYLKVEGTKGAVKIQIGLLLDYPKGKPPKFEYFILGEQEEWKEVPLIGGWFPDAFIGAMAGIQNHYLDKSIPLPHSVENAFETMRIMEAAYQSSDFGGVKLDDISN